MTDSDFQVLVDRARRISVTPSEREAQRRSFAYGNANIENPAVTREIVDQVADELARSDGFRENSDRFDTAIRT